MLLTLYPFKFLPSLSLPCHALFLNILASNVFLTNKANFTKLMFTLHEFIFVALLVYLYYYFISYPGWFHALCRKHHMTTWGKLAQTRLHSIGNWRRTVGPRGTREDQVAPIKGVKKMRRLIVEVVDRVLVGDARGDSWVSLIRLERLIY